MDGQAPLPRRRRLTQSESKDQTRNQLLAAAAKVFAQKGFAGASLEEISEVAGYTTGALYYHFQNKEQLFLELLRTGWSRQIANWVDAVNDVITDESTDPFVALSRLLVKRAEREGEFGPLAGEFWLYALRKPDAMAIVAEKLREQGDGLRITITKMMERANTAPGITPEELTVTAIELFQGLARRRRIDPNSVPDDLYGKVLRRLFTSSGDGDRAPGDCEPSANPRD